MLFAVHVRPAEALNTLADFVKVRPRINERSYIEITYMVDRNGFLVPSYGIHEYIIPEGAD